MTAPDVENSYTLEPLLPFHAIENKRYLYLALPASTVTLLCIFRPELQASVSQECLAL